MYVCKYIDGRFCIKAILEQKKHCATLHLRNFVEVEKFRFKNLVGESRSVIGSGNGRVKQAKYKIKRELE